MWNGRHSSPSLYVSVLQRCSGCHGEVAKDSPAVYAERAGYHDNLWHPACFLCSECGQSLADLVYFWSNQKLLCGRHYCQSVRPRCSGCDEVRNPKEVGGHEWRTCGPRMSNRASKTVKMVWERRNKHVTQTRTSDWLVQQPLNFPLGSFHLSNNYFDWLSCCFLSNTFLKYSSYCLFLFSENNVVLWCFLSFLSSSFVRHSLQPKMDGHFMTNITAAGRVDRVWTLPVSTDVHMSLLLRNRRSGQKIRKKTFISD